ncbi:MAG TPA: MetS family NSS transporter small subunit [Calditrichae bacterium]|nr:MetS family NSS transporter small subunit [Calditrichia bacterium]
METFSIIVMVIELTIIWGGFIYFLRKAWKSEKVK